MYLQGPDLSSAQKSAIHHDYALQQPAMNAVGKGPACKWREVDFKTLNLEKKRGIARYYPGNTPQHYKSCMPAVLENYRQAKKRSIKWGLAVYHV